MCVGIGQTVGNSQKLRFFFTGVQDQRLPRHAAKCHRVNDS